MASALLSMLLNFTVSVAIIWVNKFCYQNGFSRWNTCLTALHFLFTFLGLHISAKYFGFFEIKTVPLKKVLPISLAFVGFVVFNNLSLSYNAVGVYQLLKVLTTPVVVMIGMFLHGQKIPGLQICALIPTCAGVILATVTHLEANFWGLVFGALGILTTSFYQMWVKTEQANLGISGPALLYSQSFVSFWMLLLVSPFLEPVCGTPDSLLAFKWLDLRTPSTSKVALNSLLPRATAQKLPPAMLSRGFELCAAVTLSAMLAFLVNLSIFLVIGKTDPVSYNVLGHAKLCCILVSGYTLFGEVASTKNLIGVGLAVCGIVSYTHLKINEGKAVKDKKA